MDDLKVLLGQLSEDLPDEVKKLLEDDNVMKETLQFLDGISSIDNPDYLTAITPTPAEDSLNGGGDSGRTLVQDIAELEAKQRIVETQLKNLIIESKDQIIQNKIDLDNASQIFENDFNNNFKELWSLLNEDDINELKDVQDQDLYELELDLEPQENSNGELNKESFTSIIANIKSNDFKNDNLSVVLSNMDQIQNILELPSLTAECIKNGHYSEALEISSYTRRLAIRFSESDLIKEVENGIKKEMDMMLTGLIRLLRTNLKQSSMVKIVSYLRRIQPFNQMDNSDEQLKRIFLHSRYQFIKLELSSLVPLKKNHLTEKYCKRSIEVVREFCFGTIMTFKNIFLNVNELEMGAVEIELEEEEAKKIEEENKEDVSIAQEITKEEKKEVNGENEERTAETNDTVRDEQSENEDTTKDEQPEKDEATDNKDVNDEDNEEKQEKQQKQERQKKKEGETKEIEEGAEENETSTEVATAAPSLARQQTVSNSDLLITTENRHESNLLIFEFVKHVVEELSTILSTELVSIREKSIRHGLYLQLAYCTQSLARIDENLSDLMTATLLNKRNSETNEFIIDRFNWKQSLEKQKSLAKGFSLSSASASAVSS